MDEKRINIFLKKAIKVYTVIFLIFCLIDNVILIIGNQGKIDYLQIIKRDIKFYFNLGAIIYIPYIAIFIKRVINYINRKKKISKNNDYLMDITIKYSPAIVSLLLDLEITVFKDYTAMIAYLDWRKYIEIQELGDIINFLIVKEDISNLNPHEEYIFKCTQGMSFDSEKFKKLVIEDAKHMSLIVVNNGAIKRTKKGEREANIWKGFKNYIHDYTSVSQKDIKHVSVLDEYIPYAISLDEAKNIEKYIENNKKYRNLIYNNVKLIKDN